MAALFPLWACVNQRVLALDFLPGLSQRSSRGTSSPSGSPAGSAPPRKAVCDHEQLRKASILVPLVSAAVALVFRNNAHLVRLHAGICFAVVVVMLLRLRITLGRYVRVFSGVFAVPAVFQLLHLLFATHSIEVDGNHEKKKKKEKKHKL